MKKISLIFILLAIAISFSAKAQVFNEIYRGDKYKVVSIYNNSRNILDVLNNYDEEGFYIRSFSYPADSFSNFLLDDALNIIREDKFYCEFYKYGFRLNNKIYYFSVDGESSYFENIYLNCLDSNANQVSMDTIMRFNDDTIKWGGLNVRSLMLDDRNMIIILPSQSNIDGLSEKTKLIKIDTLGNVLNSKIYYHQNYDLDLCEMKDNLIFAINGAPSVTRFEDDCYLYYLNKETLEIEDSIKGYYPANMTRINDSILAFTFFFGQDIMGQPGDSVSSINLFNVNNKSLKNVGPYLIEGASENGLYIDFYGTGTKRIIDYTNTDSIYICYLARNGYFSYGAIELLNFNINGDTNFTYRIRFQDTCLKQIQGIKATKDGGVIIAAYSGPLYGEPDAWLIKFKPSGLIGLTNVQTGEKESIKVYPNPAKDYVNVDIECTNFRASDIELIDMQGRIVKKAKLKAKQGNSIDVSSLSSGAYTYNVSLNGKTISGKIIIGK